MLPETVVRVMRLTVDPRVNAEQLAALINAVMALSTSVLRVADGVSRRPSSPILSPQQALAWLGHDETANLAFTFMVQGKLLNIPRQNRVPPATVATGARERAVGEADGAARRVRSEHELPVRPFAQRRQTDRARDRARCRFASASSSRRSSMSGSS